MPYNPSALNAFFGFYEPLHFRNSPMDDTKNMMWYFLYWAFLAMLQLNGETCFGETALKFGTDISCFQTVNSNDFGDPLTFLVALTSGWHLQETLKHINQQLYRINCLKMWYPYSCSPWTSYRVPSQGNLFIFSIALVMTKYLQNRWHSHHSQLMDIQC